MGSKNKNTNKSDGNLLTNLMNDLGGFEPLSDNDMSNTLGGTTNHMRDNSADDGNISDDVPL